MSTRTVAGNVKGLVDSQLFCAALDELKCYGKKGTSVDWVNWRKGQYQIKVCWNGNCGLACYLNFFSSADRDAVHAELFKRYADPGTKPYLEEGHGWTKLRHSFFTQSLLSINELAEVAHEMGRKFTIIYVQECVEFRYLFTIMGIPLVPGEMGKEWIDGIMHPYSCETGKNL